MGYQFHQFGSSDNDSVPEDEKTATRSVFTGMNRKVAFVLYGIPLLLLLILLMVSGIRFSQLNQEVTAIRIHLERLVSAAEHETAVQDAYIKNVVSDGGACTDGWVSFQRSCYLVSSTAVTWSQAEQQCREHGGHLAVLNNAKELDYISGIVLPWNSYWIGLVGREHEGQWSWVDGTDFNSTTTFWDEGQPDNWDYREHGEDCGQIHGSARHKRKLWNDADCNLPYDYICEKTV